MTHVESIKHFRIEQIWMNLHLLQHLVLWPTIDHAQIKIHGQNVDWPRIFFRANVIAIQTRQLRIVSRAFYWDTEYWWPPCLKKLCNAWMHECWNQDANTVKLHEKQKHSQFPDVMKLLLFLKIVNSKLTWPSSKTSI